MWMDLTFWPLGSARTAQIIKWVSLKCLFGDLVDEVLFSPLSTILLKDSSRSVGCSKEAAGFKPQSAQSL